MKLFVILILALAAQGYANYLDSSEEDSRQSSFSHHYQWQSSVASLPGASSFKTKVTHRIKNSDVLSDMAHLKTRLFKLAEEKLEKCLKPNGRELDKHCVGRATGQVMQLIASAENSERHTANSAHRRHSSKDY
ncbi:uncharacterized protein LOC119607003 [Lucilia sericata]|uniref:uncharacterized protein LOC119607003 n=1 Tax=Lucilia sericata TaxID=13632 RepID=UPI0018A7F872|nr:uncharacterized protein LOC119607003 [Lucilia sericata]